MEVKEILKKILPEEEPYEKTLYMIYNYRDLKKGAEINEEGREIAKMIEKAVGMIEDDKYIDIIKMTMQGEKPEEIAHKIPIERNSVYKQRRRLIKRLSVIIFGDKAL